MSENLQPPKKKRVLVRGLSRGAKYALRHGYKSGSNKRRSGGRWISRLRGSAK